MEYALKSEVKKEISRIVDLMVQADSIRESIAELKKDIKNITKTNSGAVAETTAATANITFPSV